MWQGIRTESNEGLEDENQKPAGYSSLSSPRSPRHLDPMLTLTTRENAEENQPKVMEDITAHTKRSFASVIKDIPAQLPKKQAADVSVPFCFICLLHLANEKGLRIKPDATAGTNDLLITKA